VLAVSIIRMMSEAASSSETSVNVYQTTRRYNPEDNHLHTRRRKNLKSYWGKLRLIHVAAGWADESAHQWIVLNRVSSSSSRDSRSSDRRGGTHLQEQQGQRWAPSWRSMCPRRCRRRRLAPPSRCWGVSHPWYALWPSWAERHLPSTHRLLTTCPGDPLPNSLISHWKLPLRTPR
jgi:hypothetical protein